MDFHPQHELLRGLFLQTVGEFMEAVFDKMDDQTRLACRIAIPLDFGEELPGNDEDATHRTLALLESVITMTQSGKPYEHGRHALKLHSFGILVYRRMPM
jgi:hypothetical protein